MADKMTGVQGPAAPAAIESKDDLIKGALVSTGELSDGALDKVAGGAGKVADCAGKTKLVVRKAGGTQMEYLVE
jgi:hypothetical protein